jgi:hypothetical protein
MAKYVWSDGKPIQPADSRYEWSAGSPFIVTDEFILPVTMILAGVF